MQDDPLGFFKTPICSDSWPSFMSSPPRHTPPPTPTGAQSGSLLGVHALPVLQDEGAVRLLQGLQLT